MTKKRQKTKYRYTFLGLGLFLIKLEDINGYYYITLSSGRVFLGREKPEVIGELSKMTPGFQKSIKKAINWVSKGKNES